MSRILSLPSFGKIALSKSSRGRNSAELFRALRVQFSAQLSCNSHAIDSILNNSLFNCKGPQGINPENTVYSVYGVPLDRGRRQPRLLLRPLRYINTKTMCQHQNVSFSTVRSLSNRKEDRTSNIGSLKQIDHNEEWNLEPQHLLERQYKNMQDLNTRMDQQLNTKCSNLLRSAAKVDEIKKMNNIAKDENQTKQQTLLQPTNGDENRKQIGEKENQNRLHQQQNFSSSHESNDKEKLRKEKLAELTSFFPSKSSTIDDITSVRSEMSFLTDSFLDFKRNRKDILKMEDRIVLDNLFDSTFKTMDALRNATRKETNLKVRGTENLPTLSELYSQALDIYAYGRGDSPKTRVGTIIERNANVKEEERKESDSGKYYRAALLILYDQHQLRMDIKAQHFASVISAACHGKLWGEGSALFKAQLDGDAGMTPLVSTDPVGTNDASTQRNNRVCCPLRCGLYVMARAARQEYSERGDVTDSQNLEGVVDRNSGKSGGILSFFTGRDDVHAQTEEPLAEHDRGSVLVADTVFDAVNRLSMVSSSDHLNYIMAAIAALGEAGEWESCIYYMKNSDEAVKIGQPLVAAVMEACLVCKKPDEALKLYEEIRLSVETTVGREWQTGGRFDDILPSVRSTALRAALFASAHSSGKSDVLINHFKDVVDSQIPLKLSTIENIVYNCEQDGNVFGAIHVVESMIDGELNILINDSDDYVGSDVLPDNFFLENPSFSKILSSSVRTCNSAKEYGISLLMWITLCISSSTEGLNNQLRLDSHHPSNDYLKMVLERAISMESDELLDALIVSIYGFAGETGDEPLQHVHKKVINTLETLFFEANSSEKTAWVSTARHLAQSHKRSWNFQDRENSDFINERASSGESEKNSILQDSVMHEILKLSYLMNVDNHLVMTSDISKMMRLCVAASQPNVGLHLARRIAEVCAWNDTGFQFVQPSKRDDEHAKFSESPYLVSTDDIAAATIAALRATGRHMDAVDLYLEKFQAAKNEHGGTSTLQYEDISQWILSPHECMITLIDLGDFEGAETIFDVMNMNIRTPVTYSILTGGYANSGNWAKVLSTWERAVANRSLSENLCLDTLQALANGMQTPEDISLFITVAKALENLIGLKKGEWIKKYYSFIKEKIDDSKIMQRVHYKDWELTLLMERFEEKKRALQSSEIETAISIVNLAGYHQRYNQCDGHPVPDVDESAQRERLQQIDNREEGRCLILYILEEAWISGFGDNEEFLVCVAKSLRALKANNDLFSLLRNQLSRGISVSYELYQQAILAADSSEDWAAKTEFVSEAGRAGFAFR